MKILITGSAGFIGFHLAYHLCKNGYTVLGIDNLNDYYDVNLKKARLNQLSPFSKNDKFNFLKLDITQKNDLEEIFKNNEFDLVVHLAAQAGVRYSLENPHSYIESNVVGFMNMLECCRKFKVLNILYASSSSVYGKNEKLPFCEGDRVDDPLSIYAVTKRSNELMAKVYSELFNINTIGLRFFTVYGPWGRPDMALYKFTKNILDGLPLDLYNNGNHQRSFTYISDIINSIENLIYKIERDKINNLSLVYNIGGKNSIGLVEFINQIEKVLGKKGKYNKLPLQTGDVISTISDSQLLENEVGYSPSTTIEYGIRKFVNWFKKYYQYD